MRLGTAGGFEGTLDTVRFWMEATDANVQRKGKDKGTEAWVVYLFLEPVPKIEKGNH